ncbi:MAG: MlaE family ABC transporter permease [bacterium]
MKMITDGLAALGRAGILLKQCLVSLFKKGIIDRRILFEQLAEVGIASIPIALLIALFAGFVIGLQLALQFQRFGALSVLGGLVALTFVRELGPVLTGVVVAGRVGSAFTAEIGSMKVTEQLDALRAMAVDPLAYLMVPRLLACLVMLPILVTFADIVGTLSGYLMSAACTDLTFTAYIDSIKLLLTTHDIVSGFIKALFFGLIIVLIGCYQGFAVRGGASGVGRATTQSVVVSIIFIFLSNCFFTAVFFQN